MNVNAVDVRIRFHLFLWYGFMGFAVLLLGFFLAASPSFLAVMATGFAWLMLLPYHAQVAFYLALSTFSSALILPFISSTHRVVGLQAMKAFFRVLYLESRLTGKPIVYLAHPTEFRNRKAGGESRFHESVKLRYFSPAFIRIHGFRPRNLLYRVNGEALLESTRSLFGYMASFPDVVPMTVSEYVQQYLENRI